MPVYHWDVAPEQADDIRAAAKWAWKCLVDLANVFCAHHCDPFCSKDGLPPAVLDGAEGPSREARQKRRAQWLATQYALHEAVAFLPPLLPSSRECAACAIVRALAQFPKLVPFSPRPPVATQQRNGVDCYPEMLSDPSKRSIPCCIMETSVGDGHETAVNNAVREQALTELDLDELPPIPPREFAQIKPEMDAGAAVAHRLLDLREGQSDAAEPAVSAVREQQQGHGEREEASRLDAALERLLSAVEKHRLAFLFCAYPRRKNPLAVNSETGIWETVRKNTFPGWTDMEGDAAEDGEFLFRNRRVLDAYAQEAISEFGPGEGCRPSIRDRDDKWVDVEGGTLPRWSLEEELCPNLEESSQALLDACAAVSTCDRGHAFATLLQQVMAVAHDRGQPRWYASVVVRWAYLADLDHAIDAVRKAGIAATTGSGSKEPRARAEVVSAQTGGGSGAGSEEVAAHGSSPASLRLKWLCDDMIHRLEHETDHNGFGSIDLRLKEAAALALELGFETPPICSMCYLVDHEVHNYTLDSKEKASLGFLLAKHKIPHLLAIWFYRVYDPAGGEPIDIVKAGESPA